MSKLFKQCCSCCDDSESSSEVPPGANIIWDPVTAQGRVTLDAGTNSVLPSAEQSSLSYARETQLPLLSSSPFSSSSSDTKTSLTGKYNKSHSLADEPPKLFSFEELFDQRLKADKDRLAKELQIKEEEEAREFVAIKQRIDDEKRIAERNQAEKGKTKKSSSTSSSSSFSSSKTKKHPKSLGEGGVYYMRSSSSSSSRSRKPKISTQPVAPQYALPEVKQTDRVAQSLTSRDPDDIMQSLNELNDILKGAVIQAPAEVPSPPSSSPTVEEGQTAEGIYVAIPEVPTDVASLLEELSSSPLSPSSSETVLRQEPPKVEIVSTSQEQEKPYSSSSPSSSSEGALVDPARDKIVVAEPQEDPEIVEMQTEEKRFSSSSSSSPPEEAGVAFEDQPGVADVPKTYTVEGPQSEAPEIVTTEKTYTVQEPRLEELLFEALEVIRGKPSSSSSSDDIQETTDVVIEEPTEERIIVQIHKMREEKTSSSSKEQVIAEELTETLIVVDARTTAATLSSASSEEEVETTVLAEEPVEPAVIEDAPEVSEEAPKFFPSSLEGPTVKNVPKDTFVVDDSPKRKSSSSPSSSYEDQHGSVATVEEPMEELTSVAPETVMVQDLIVESVEEPLVQDPSVKAAPAQLAEEHVLEIVESIEQRSSSSPSSPETPDNVPEIIVESVQSPIIADIPAEEPSQPSVVDAEKPSSSSSSSSENVIEVSAEEKPASQELGVTEEAPQPEKESIAAEPVGGVGTETEPETAVVDAPEILIEESSSSSSSSSEDVPKAVEPAVVAAPEINLAFVAPTEETINAVVAMAKEQRSSSSSSEEVEDALEPPLPVEATPREQSPMEVNEEPLEPVAQTLPPLAAPEDVVIPSLSLETPTEVPEIPTEPAVVDTKENSPSFSSFSSGEKELQQLPQPQYREQLYQTQYQQQPGRPQQEIVTIPKWQQELKAKRRESQNRLFGALKDPKTTNRSLEGAEEKPAQKQIPQEFERSVLISFETNIAKPVQQSNVPGLERKKSSSSSSSGDEEKEVDIENPQEQSEPVVISVADKPEQTLELQTEELGQDLQHQETIQETKSEIHPPREQRALEPAVIFLIDELESEQRHESHTQYNNKTLSSSSSSSDSEEKKTTTDYEGGIYEISEIKERTARKGDRKKGKLREHDTKPENEQETEDSHNHESERKNQAGDKHKHDNKSDHKNRDRKSKRSSSRSRTSKIKAPTQSLDPMPAEMPIHPAMEEYKKQKTKRGSSTKSEKRRSSKKSPSKHAISTIEKPQETVHLISLEPTPSTHATPERKSSRRKSSGRSRSKNTIDLTNSETNEISEQPVVIDLGHRPSAELTPEKNRNSRRRTEKTLDTSTSEPSTPQTPTKEAFSIDLGRGESQYRLFRRKSAGSAAMALKKLTRRASDALSSNEKRGSRGSLKRTSTDANENSEATLHPNIGDLTTSTSESGFIHGSRKKSKPHLSGSTGDLTTESSTPSLIIIRRLSKASAGGTVSDAPTKDKRSRKFSRSKSVEAPKAQMEKNEKGELQEKKYKGGKEKEKKKEEK